MATSGTYNNYFEYDGKKFSHIINPKTGYPYEHSIVSATIIANECIDADAYATMAMTMKIDDLRRKLRDVEVEIQEFIDTYDMEDLKRKKTIFIFLLRILG